jgi:hypothetical protein
VARVILAALLIFPLVATARPQCLDPLSKANAMSHQRSDWSKLEKLAPNVHEEGVVRVQAITDGMGPINLDFYSITFRKHPTKSLSDEFFDIRQHFSNFAHREGTAFEDEASTYFLPYRASSAEDDRVRAHNKSVWESKNPMGAVMSFVLDNHTPALALAATLRGVKIVLEQGDVVVTCVDPLNAPTQFIFTTVFTVKDEYHPVNGNRGFGIRDNGDGTWTFYTMGADRETKVGSSGGVDVPYFGNSVLKSKLANFAIDRGIPPGPDAVFVAGDKFWRDFFSNLVEYLNRNGMRVDPSSFVRNSQRYPYP